MPRNVNTKRETAFPTRGVPGGHRDWWDGPPAHVAIRARLERWEAERRRVGAELRREVAAGRKRRRNMPKAA